MHASLAELQGPDAPAVLLRLREAGPVVPIESPGGWLVIGYGAAVDVMRDAGAFTVDDPRFSTARVVGPSMLSLDGAAHQRHRAAFADPFRPGRIEDRFRSDIEDRAQRLIAAVRTAGRADLRAVLAGPLAVSVVTSILGLEGVGPDAVLGWYADIAGAVSAITSGSEPDTAGKRAMDDLGSHVLARGSTDAESPIAVAGGALDPDEVVSNAAVVMFGGIETTEAMIANVLFHVLGSPAATQALLTDRSRATVAVEESLRLEPAAAFVDRYATRRVELAGRTIAAGDLVRISLMGANRDPSVFDQPDRFDLGRPNGRAQLAFARGPHVCLARDLARLEAQVALTAVLDLLPGVRLERPSPPQGLVFRKPAHVTAGWDG